MKKMMVALVAVALASFAQAASVNWSNTGTRTAGTIYNATGTAIGTGAVAYLFDVATLSQADLLTAVRAGTDISTLGAIDSATTASSKIAKTADITYGTAGSDVTMYFAIVNGDDLLISSSLTKGIQAADTTTYAFTDSATWSKNTFAADASYSAAGWYSTTAVPEPTSGLLLLLGMAGLALKRKRA